MVRVDKPDEPVSLKFAGDLLPPPRDFDVKKYVKAGPREQMRIAADSWARQGFGVPSPILLFYVLKMAGYMYTIYWLTGYCQFEQGSAEWRADSFRRFVAFNLLFEILHLGCATGPLCGHFYPPLTAIVHWLWPGSVKLPWRVDAKDGRTPFLSFLGTKRTYVDVGVMLAHLYFLVRAVTAPVVGRDQVLPYICTLMLLSVLDHTIFLASRGEQYLWVSITFLLESQWNGSSSAPERFTGAKLMQMAIWMWASMSKWGNWFPFVVQVMVANSPCVPWEWAKGLMFKDVKNGDFRTSKLCYYVAHFGTFTEFLFPLGLAMGGDTLIGKFALVTALGFHVFIMSNIAMGVPQEWNLYCSTAAIYLFGPTDYGCLGGLRQSDITSLPMSAAAFLLTAAVILPLLGNLYPKYVSFLVAMRYYAGNWPGSVWLVKKSAWSKLYRLPTASRVVGDQLGLLYEPRDIINYGHRIMAFRMLHAHGRLLPGLIDLALNGGEPVKETKNGKRGKTKLNWNDYQYCEGEFMAAFALGYNFGDGYLHGKYMVNAIQQWCKFEEGELIHISWDSFPFMGSLIPWEIHDATDMFGKPIAQGKTDIKDAFEMQPY